MNAGELLTHSLSPDHATRQAAEQALEAAARDSYPMYMTSLSSEMASEAALVHIRTASGLALKNALVAREARRAQDYADRWTALSAEARDQVKSKVLMTLSSSEPRAGTVAAQVTAAIAAIELPRGMWPDLVSQLLAAIRYSGRTERGDVARGAARRAARPAQLARVRAPQL